MEIVNLTPHTINVIGEGGTAEIQSSGSARVTFAPDIPDQPVQTSGAEIPVFVTASTGAVVGLPEPRTGTLYVVSRQVYDACPNRRDLLITHRAIRGDDGRIIGCRAFARPSRG